MTSFKTRDKPLRKVKQRVSTVVVVLLCILSLGVVSSLTLFSSASGGSSGGGGTSSSRPTVDSGNSNTGDNSGNGSTGDSSGGNEGETPGGSAGDNTGGDSSGGSAGGNTGDSPKMLNEQFFSESLSYNAGDEAVYYKGGALLNDRLTYGIVDTSEGYLRYRPKAEEVGTEVSKSILSLYLNKESSILSELPLHLDEAAYITIDFDIWSDTGVLPELAFSLQTSNEESYLEEYFFGFDYRGDQCFYNIHGPLDFFDIDYFMHPVDINSPIHITLLIQVTYSDYENWFYDYLNGKELCITQDSYLDCALRLLELNVNVLRHSVLENESICIDNLQVYSYGSSPGNYDGDLSKHSPNKPITDYTDWILYDKYKTEKGEE